MTVDHLRSVRLDHVSALASTCDENRKQNQVYRISAPRAQGVFSGCGDLFSKFVFIALSKFYW